MDDELEFEVGAKSSRSAKTGRRAQAGSRNINPPDAPSFEGSGSNNSPRENKSQQREDLDGPPKPNRVSGWGEDAPRKSRRLGEGFEPFEDERLRPQSRESDDNSEADIPVIPDLEDQQDEDMTSKIAIAPNIAVNRVATYRELDNDLLKQAAFLTLDNEIDLKLLTKSLSAEADLIEDDKPWDWDRLFTEVTSELFVQAETTEEKEPLDQEVLP